MSSNQKLKSTNGTSLSEGTTNKKVRLMSPSSNSTDNKFEYGSGNSSDDKINPMLLPTVENRKKGSNRPVSRRTKVARNQAEQERLAKQRTYQTINYLTRKTRFNSEEVKALLEIYRKIRGSGKMDRLRFRETIHNNLGLTDDVMLDRIFASFDGDNEGSVSESEWVIGLSVMIRGDLEEQIAYCYEVYDVNGDRAIGRDELATCLRGCLYPIPGREDEADDLEEGTREIVELVMRKLDLDHDGVIKYADFHQAVKQDPILLQAIGPCLPTNSAMMTFISLYDVQTRNYSTHLSHKKDPAWLREKDKFNPVVADEIKRKMRATRVDGSLKLTSVFSSVSSKGIRRKQSD